MALECALILMPVLLLMVLLLQMCIIFRIEYHIMLNERKYLEMYPLTQSNVIELSEKFKQYFFAQHTANIALAQTNVQILEEKLTMGSLCRVQTDWIFRLKYWQFDVRYRWNVPVVCTI